MVVSGQYSVSSIEGASRCSEGGVLLAAQTNKRDLTIRGQLEFLDGKDAEAGEAELKKLLKDGQMAIEKPLAGVKSRPAVKGEEVYQKELVRSMEALRDALPVAVIERKDRMVSVQLVLKTPESGLALYSLLPKKKQVN